LITKELLEKLPNPFCLIIAGSRTFDRVVLTSQVDAAVRAYLNNFFTLHPEFKVTGEERAIVHCMLIDRLVVVSGHARGADRAGEEWFKGYVRQRFSSDQSYRAFHEGLEPQAIVLPARWRNADGSFNQKAGHERNALMGDIAHVLLAFWDGESGGTRHMIRYMEGAGKPVHIILTR